VIDVATRKVIARHAAGTDPEQFAVTPDGTRLYSSNEDAGTASGTNLGSGKVVATLVVGIEPEGVAVSPDGRWVYVTAETSNTVSVIDTRTNVVTASFLAPCLCRERSHVGSFGHRRRHAACGPTDPRRAPAVGHRDFVGWAVALHSERSL
jgi:YVTN family beta-propeller protein